MASRDILSNISAGVGALALASVLLAGCATGGSPGDGEASRPNIIVIFIDDMGYGDLGVTGNDKVATPNIDGLAAEGTLFTRFYVNSPICSPSRVALTTGTYPSRLGVHSFIASREQNRNRGVADWLDPTTPTLADALKEVGYATAHFGKWHMGGGRDIGEAPLITEYGFDESETSFEGLGNRYLWRGSEDALNQQSAALGRGEIRWTEKHQVTAHYVDDAIDFMRRHRDAPFYINLWPNDVHDPFAPVPALAAKYEGVGRNDYERDLFAVIDEMDRQLGRLFEELDRLGIEDETIVILTGDNGPTDWARYYREGVIPPGSSGDFRGRKWSLYEGGIREPLIVRWPGRVPDGRVDGESLLSAIDLVPTLAALAGAELADGRAVDGEDLRGTLLGRTGGRQAPLYWHYPNDILPGDTSFITPRFAMLDGSWKLLAERDGSGAELYNLSSDPREANNLAAAEPARTARMSQSLLKWASELPLPAPSPAAAE